MQPKKTLTRKTLPPYFPYYVEAIRKYRAGKISDTELIRQFTDKFKDYTLNAYNTHKQVLDFLENNQTDQKGNNNVS